MIEKTLGRTRMWKDLIHCSKFKCQQRQPDSTYISGEMKWTCFECSLKPGAWPTRGWSRDNIK